MPQSSTPIPTLPEQASRLALIDKAVARRIDQATELDNRLAARAEFLTRAEENLKGLLESLRRNTGELSPIIAQIPYLRENASVITSDLLAEARAQITRLIEPIEARINALAAESQQQLIATSQQLREEARKDLSQHLVEWLEDHQELAQTRGTQVKADLEIHCQRALDTMAESARSLGNALDHQLNQVRAEAQQVVHQMKTCIQQADDLADKVGSGLSDRLGQMLEQAHLQTNQAVQAIQQDIGQQIGVISQQARANIQPVIDQFDQANENFQNQVSDLGSRLAHLGNLQTHCSSLGRELEEKLQQQMQHWENQAHRLVHGVEQQLGQCVSQLIDTRRQNLCSEIARTDEAAARLARLRETATRSTGAAPGTADQPAIEVQIHPELADEAQSTHDESEQNASAA